MRQDDRPAPQPPGSLGAGLLLDLQGVLPALLCVLLQVLLCVLDRVIIPILGLGLDLLLLGLRLIPSGGTLFSDFHRAIELRDLFGNVRQGPVDVVRGILQLNLSFILVDVAPSAAAPPSARAARAARGILVGGLLQLAGRRLLGRSFLPFAGRAPPPATRPPPLASRCTDLVVSVEIEQRDLLEEWSRDPVLALHLGDLRAGLGLWLLRRTASTAPAPPSATSGATCPSRPLLVTLLGRSRRLGHRLGLLRQRLRGLPRAEDAQLQWSIPARAKLEQLVRHAQRAKRLHDSDADLLARQHEPRSLETHRTCGVRQHHRQHRLKHQRGVENRPERLQRELIARRRDHRSPLYVDTHQIQYVAIGTPQRPGDQSPQRVPGAKQRNRGSPHSFLSLAYPPIVETLAQLTLECVQRTGQAIRGHPNTRFLRQDRVEKHTTIVGLQLGHAARQEHQLDATSYSANSASVLRRQALQRRHRSREELAVRRPRQVTCNGRDGEDSRLLHRLRLDPQDRVGQRRGRDRPEAIRELPHQPQTTPCRSRPLRCNGDDVSRKALFLDQATRRGHRRQHGIATRLRGKCDHERVAALTLSHPDGRVAGGNLLGSPRIQRTRRHDLLLDDALHPVRCIDRRGRSLCRARGSSSARKAPHAGNLLESISTEPSGALTWLALPRFPVPIDSPCPQQVSPYAWPSPVVPPPPLRLFRSASRTGASSASLSATATTFSSGVRSRKAVAAARQPRASASRSSFHSG